MTDYHKIRQEDSRILSFRRVFIRSSFIGSFHQWHHFSGESMMSNITAVIISNFSADLIGILYYGSLYRGMCIRVSLLVFAF